MAATPSVPLMHGGGNQDNFDAGSSFANGTLPVRPSMAEFPSWWNETSAQFEKPDFDALHWVNMVLSSGKIGANPLSYNPPESPSPSQSADPAVLITTLSSASSLNVNRSVELECIDVLEHAIIMTEQDIDLALHTCVSQVPWALREIDHVRQRATALRGLVDGAKLRIASVESSAAESAVTVIVDADRTVRRVEAARDLLRKVSEAERLMERLDAVFASGDLSAVADTLSSLRKSLGSLNQIRSIAKKSETLSLADHRLEDMAGPIIRASLEKHAEDGLQSAMQVLQRAGRGDCFTDVCSQFYADTILRMWTRITDSVYIERVTMISNVPVGTKVPGGIQEPLEKKTERVKPSSVSLVDPLASIILATFYDELFSFLGREKSWLFKYTGEVTGRILAMGVFVALMGLNPTMDQQSFSLGAQGLRSDSLAGAEMARKSDKKELELLELNAMKSAVFAYNFSNIILDKEQIATEDLDPAFEAISSCLLPLRVFLYSYYDVETKRVTQQVHNLSNFNTPKAVDLVELSRSIERVSTEILKVSTSIQGNCLQWTQGVCIDGAMRASGKAVSIFCDRVKGLIDAAEERKGKGASQTAHVEIQGSLRVLLALGSMCFKWNAWKQSFINEALTAAAPLLEVLNGEILREEKKDKRIEMLLRGFVQRSQSGLEGGLLWQLGTDQKLMNSCVRAFENYVGSDSSDKDADFRTILSRAILYAYDCIFSNIHEHLDSFDVSLYQLDQKVDAQKTAEASAETVDEDLDSELPMFSAAPSSYAADIGEYLMLVPQQIEPFVPSDENIAVLTSPKDMSFLRGGKYSSNIGGTSSMAMIPDVEGGSGGAVFARRWIAAVSIGTMEALVSRICSLNTIGPRGSAQLATDLDYLSNVLSMLGVSPTASFAGTIALLSASTDTYQAVAMSLLAPEVKSISAKIARLRGIRG